jgi:hypothetical protein
MRSNIFKFGSRFFVSLLILTMTLSTAAILVPSHRAWAETPEEKAQKEADKKAKEEAKKLEEQQKRIADWHKRAEENIRYKFDRFKKSTLVACDNEKVRSISALFGTFGDLYLSPDATVPDEVKKETLPAKAPATVQLFFWANAEKEATLLYSNAKELNFLVDGKPLGPYEVKYTSGPDGDNFMENMIVEVPYAEFRKIVSCKDTTEGRLGEMEFKFNDYQKILYRTFLTRITPAEAAK